MNGTLSKFLIFTAGAAIGSVVTWGLVRKYYERLANEEIESVKQMLLDRQSEPTEGSTEKHVVFDDGTKEEYRQLTKLYSDGSVMEANNVVKPYVITPEEFGERGGYDTESLTLYEDGVLTDDQDNVIEDVDNIVGYDSLNHFGEYEDDSVFVRNEAQETDYEILLDSRKYSDVVKNSPRRAEGK